MRTTAVNAEQLRSKWVAELPIRIHSSEIGDDGAPRWHPEFERWLTRSQRPPALGSDPSMRATRVFRQLRKTSKREYEVVYRLLILGDTVEGTCTWLNQRAAANSIPLPPGRRQHYTPRDVLGLFIAGVDFAYQLL